jgi:hypothetical protein
MWSSSKHATAGRYCPWQETSDLTLQYDLCRGNQNLALPACTVNVYLLTYLLNHLPTYIHTYIHTYLPTYLYTYPSIHPSIHPSTHPKGEGKVYSIIGHEGTEGEYKFSSTLSLTSALDGAGCSTPCSSQFTPKKKTQYPLYGRLGRPQGRSGKVQKISPPPGIRSPDRPVRSKSLYRLSYPGPPLQEPFPIHPQQYKALLSTQLSYF